MNILKMLLLGILLVLFTACGSSNTGNDTVDTAINKFIAYAEAGGTGSAPTLQDYLDAGVTGVTSDNIADINEVIGNLTESEVDTQEEVQALANELGVAVADPGNTPPIAKAGAIPTNLIEGEIVAFSSRHSSDPDGTIESYRWTENGVGLAKVPSFTKSDFSVGTHTVTLTVTDNDGATDTDTVTISIVAAPKPKPAPVSNQAPAPGPVASFTGIHTDVAIADLTGWTECYKSTYAASGHTLDSIKSNCSGSKIMLACRVTNSDTLQLAAAASRDEVFLNTGNGNNDVHTANGVDWYYSESTSMGFAPVGEGVKRNSADVQNTNNDDRLSWHTNGGTLTGGFRCGSDTWINSSTAFERLIYQAD